MGAALGLVAGIGMLLIVVSFGSARPARPPRPRRATTRARDVLAAAGLASVTPIALVGTSVAVGVVTGVLILAVARSVAVAGAFAVIAGYGPLAVVRYRANRRRTERRELWPEAVDNLVSAVRAGLSLPEALTQLGARGPEGLREPFAQFGEDYRATGRFDSSLDRLKNRLADPVGDRVVESLRMAREVGGGDLGRLLRTLSTFLREDARTRAELETRQGWTVGAARLAVAAPWVILLLLSTQPGAVAAYDSPTGVLVLAGGAGVCLLAYRLMLRIGRLPTEERVLR